MLLRDASILRSGLLRSSLVLSAALAVVLAAATPRHALAADAEATVAEVTVAEWQRLTEAASGGDAAAAAAMQGYLAGLRDALKFYSRLGRTFRICWPDDHEIDLNLLESVVRAVRREHPDLARPSDNYAYVVTLALLNAYACR